MEKETITNKYSSINNNKKNKNTNNNDNNDDNVRLLMTKRLILVITEELVLITVITAIKLTYRQNSMEKKNKNKENNKQTCPGKLP